MGKRSSPLFFDSDYLIELTFADRSLTRKEIM